MPTAWSVLSVQFPPVDPIRLKIRLKPVFGHEKTPETPVFREFWLEVTPGFEPGNEGFADPCLTTWLCHRMTERTEVLSVFGAGDEARTRYLDLGKVALYQMSYARKRRRCCGTLVPPVGVEPTTRGFSVRCSTN